MDEHSSYEDELDLVRSVLSARSLLAAIERRLIIGVGPIDELQRAASIRIPDDDLRDQLIAARTETGAHTLRRARELGIIATPDRTEETGRNLHRRPPTSILTP